MSHIPPGPKTSSGFCVGAGFGACGWVEVCAGELLSLDCCPWLELVTGETDQNKKSETFMQVTFTLFAVATSFSFAHGAPARI